MLEHYTASGLQRNPGRIFIAHSAPSCKVPPPTLRLGAISTSKPVKPGKHAKVRKRQLMSGHGPSWVLEEGEREEERERKRSTMKLSRMVISLFPHPPDPTNIDVCTWRRSWATKKNWILTFCCLSQIYFWMYWGRFSLSDDRVFSFALQLCGWRSYGMEVCVAQNLFLCLKPRPSLQLFVVWDTVWHSGSST